MVYIISGLKRKPKFISGKSTVKIPFLQRVDKLSLEMLSVDVKTSKTIPTADYINILVDSVATVKITNTEESSYSARIVLHTEYYSVLFKENHKKFITFDDLSRIFFVTLNIICITVTLKRSKN